MTVSERVWSWQQAADFCKAWRTKGESIVFTNGCFDILHAGHVDLLEQARGLGHRLVVGLNDDDSIRRLKGAERPVNPVEDRAFVLAGLRAVDGVVVFTEDTPLALIETLQPDVLVKGGDYAPDEIVGADVVRARGGRVCIVPLVEGRATSSLIQRIRGDAG